MVSENFITSIRSQERSTNTAIAKDVGIYLHELHPSPNIKSSFKKSSTAVKALAVNSTHIFAAQAEKAVVHVYSRERGNQEALISFPERLQSLSLVGDGVLVLGTVEGRIILWEVYTGRQVSTPAAHLQAISCIAASQLHLISGSEDSNIHVWSLSGLLGINSTETHEPIRTLSNHRAVITDVVMGHSTASTNICVSASKDNTVIVWNYHTGDLLRTFLLPTTPLCLAIDPCDRGVYVGSDDATLRILEFLHPASTINILYDRSLQSTPVQVTEPPWSGEDDLGAVLCLGLSYDGVTLLAGHASGRVCRWDTGSRRSASDATDLNAPVTNIVMLSPFPTKRLTKAATVVKPKLSEGNYTFTSQFTRNLENHPLDRTLTSPGFPYEMLEDAISRFYLPATSGEDSKLSKENDELREVISKQQELLLKTQQKYSKLKSGTA